MVCHEYAYIHVYAYIRVCIRMINLINGLFAYLNHDLIGKCFFFMSLLISFTDNYYDDSVTL